jgi:hypothetical protein
MEKKRYYKKKGGEEHVGREWDSDESSTDSSSDEDAANIAINKGLLFPNIGHKCQKKKINELIETINEKDDLLECQEDLLVKENKKFVKLKNAYALEV